MKKNNIDNNYSMRDQRATFDVIGHCALSDGIGKVTVTEKKMRNQVTVLHMFSLNDFRG